MRGGVVISHSPGHREEAEEEGEALWLPAGVLLNVREDVFWSVLVLGLNEEGDTAGDEDADVEDDVALGHLFNPVGGHGVDTSREDGKTGHDTNGRVGGDFILEVGSNGDGGEQHLCGTVLGRGNTSDLTKKVDPSGHPRQDWRVLFWCQAGDSVVKSSRCWVCRDELSDRERQAETSRSSNQPTPHGGSRSSSI